MDNNFIDKFENYVIKFKFNNIFTTYARQQKVTPACRNGLRRAGTAFGRGWPVHAL